MTAAHGYTMKTYLESWGRAFADRIQLLAYEDLQRLRQFAPGTYIFSDLERLSAVQTEMATQVFEQLSAAGPSVRTLNNPGRVLRRYALLRTLHDTGINRFGVARATDARAAHHFPVFVREENQHDSILTPLLHTQSELEKALVHVVVAGHRLQDLLIVEFCDAADAAGIYRNYGAFIVGGRILPRNLLFNREWFVKRRTSMEIAEERVLEEQNFLKTNPHESWLRKVFSIAGVDYGRMDYGVAAGEPQAWEINTNPAVIHPPEAYHPMLLPAQGYFGESLASALEAIDCAPETSAEKSSVVRVVIPPSLVRRVETERRRQRRAQAFRKVVHAVQESRFVQPLVQHLKPFVDSYAGWFVRILKVFRTSG